MKKKGKIISFIIGCVLLFWVYKVIKVNNEVGITNKDYTMGEEIYNGNIKIVPMEAHIYTTDEYINHFNVELDEYWLPDESTEYLIVCMKLQITNNGKNDVDWDVIISSLGYGFESDTWCSSIVPQLCAPINCFSSDVLVVGESQELWLATTVIKICFKDSTWKRIEQEQFYYVMETYPERKRIKLDFEYTGER